MMELATALLILALTAAGGYLIRDMRALAVFVGLSATAAFLLAILLSIPSVVLGLLGLSAGAVRTLRRPELRTWRPRMYKSRRRLAALEEMARRLPARIIDVVPAGSSRSIHPKLLEIMGTVERAAASGYSVSMPQWLEELVAYRKLLGYQFLATETTVVGETEVFTLD